MATAGKTLRVERIRADVTIVELAARMGLSRQAIWATERSAAVDESRVQQYRSALLAIRDAKETPRLPEQVA